MSGSATRLRSIRSYVRREGRITRAQRRALRELWPKYGIGEEHALLDFAKVFGRRSSVSLEIGFGNGEALCELARTNPRKDYLGVEVYGSGIGSLLLRLEERGLLNVRVIADDAIQVLASRIPDASLEAIFLFFPDPWPKKRHHKRRLVQRAFVELVARKLQARGCFHMATDWEDYAEHVLAVVAQVPTLKAVALADAARDSRHVTRFERRGRALGHRIWELIYERVP